MAARPSAVFFLIEVFFSKQMSAFVWKRTLKFFIVFTITNARICDEEELQTFFVSIAVAIRT